MSEYVHLILTRWAGVTDAPCGRITAKLYLDGLIKTPKEFEVVVKCIGELVSEFLTVVNLVKGLRREWMEHM